jgi:hypothetical protein
MRRARDNPFATDRVLRIRYRLAHGSLDELLDRWTALGCRAALVGPEGSGKTTLLEDLAEPLRARGFGVRPIRLSRSRPQRAGVLWQDLLRQRPGPADVILLDGAEQLGWLHWNLVRRRSRRCGGLVIATHRPGRLPTLITCRTTPELLAWIVHELLGPGDRLVRPSATELFERHHGNVRDALRELYDLWAMDGIQLHSTSPPGAPSSISRSDGRKNPPVSPLSTGGNR